MDDAVLPNDPAWLVEQFEANRAHLQAVALRMLGSSSEADDAVQESWIRLSRPDTGNVANLGGWLTTVVARISLDMLRSRRTRREEALDGNVIERFESSEVGIDPEGEAVLADSVGPALLVVLETLTPGERLAFVLHDMFALPFEEIGPSSGARRPRRGNSRAGRAAGRRAHSPRPTPTGSASARSSVHSSPLPAAATSMRSSRYSTPTSCSASTAGPQREAGRRWSAARKR